MKNKLKILVIDDNQIIRRIIKEELEEAGYEVYEASDGISGIVKATQILPDLITIDLEMPKIDGFITLEKLRSANYIKHFTNIKDGKIPVIFLTANDTFDARIKGFNLGVADFITKPFSKGKILETVRKILEPSKDLEGLTVLLVDDSTLARIIASHILKEAGLTVIECENGIQAYEIFKEKMSYIDIIITDYIMPEMNGHELCKKIKKELNATDIPIIFLTAVSDRSNLIELFKSGATDYIIKPFVKEELIARIFAHLERAKLIKTLKDNLDSLKKAKERLEEDLLAAAEIQRSLLPKKLPDVNKLTFASKFIPSEFIGGDIFNIFQIDKEHIGVYMIDVSGHGIPAAMVTFSVSQILHDCKEVFSSINNWLNKHDPGENVSYTILSPASILNMLEHEYPIQRFDKFFTIIYLVIDIQNGTLTYSNAGHPPPAIISKNGYFTVLEEGGTLIGTGEQIPYEEKTVQFNSGDKLILYTDGVIEYQNKKKELYGQERLYLLLKNIYYKSINSILDEIYNNILIFGENAGIQDDVSIIGIEFNYI